MDYTLNYESATRYIAGVEVTNNIHYVGYSNSYNYVHRFSFTTGTNGATNITIRTNPGTSASNGIRHYQGKDWQQIPYYITESATSHVNANASSYMVTGWISKTGTAKDLPYEGSNSMILKPNTTYYIFFFPNNNEFSLVLWLGNLYISTSGSSKFSLSISAGTGSSITVLRTSSDVGASLTSLSHNSAIYYGDKLKISFAAQTNYTLSSTTVNGAAFTSGSTFTVTGATSVVSTAQELLSLITASNAEIEGKSNIVITRYNTAYRHVVTYNFDGGKATGTIIAKTSNVTSTSWSIPSSFYAQMTNKKSAQCIIKCETYSSSSATIPLGSNEVAITISANETKCKPTLVCSVKDTNSAAVVLSGNDNTLIKYVSNAKCTLTSTAKNSATIVERRINKVSLNADGSTTFAGVTDTAFEFYIKDSRGFVTSTTIRPTIIPYEKITINPTYNRTTDGKIYVSFNGTFYNGNFGARQNGIVVSYKYRELGQTAWSTETRIANSNFTVGSNSYRTPTPYLLSGNFDYTKSYEIIIYGADSALLSSKQQTLNKVVPVFDWGENDFTFHVPIISTATKEVTPTVPTNIDPYYLSPNPKVSVTAGNVYVSFTIQSDGDSHPQYKTIMTNLPPSTRSFEYTYFGKDGVIYGFRVSGGNLEANCKLVTNYNLSVTHITLQYCTNAAL